MKTLKLALLGATFLAGASALSAANAADVYSRGGSIKDTGPVDYAPAITWTGFYVGVHAGTTFDDSATIDVLGEPFASIEADEQFVAGVHVGYNWQTSRNLVLGIEGNITIPSDSDEFGADYLGSLRGRVGYAADKTLFYATGGVALLSWQDEVFDDSSFGWVAGLGVEHKIRNNLSIGLEGLYYSFEDDFAGGAVEVERDLWTIQARLTYHLGDSGHSEPLK